MTGTLSHIHVGLPRRVILAGSDQKFRTAYFKEPSLLPVYVGFERIDGDGQANLKFHGGPDRPILAYCGEHYPRWRAELNRPDMGPGGFGENFTIDSGDDMPMDETTVCLGDQFEIGDLIVEVSQPREPCATLTRRWDMPELAELVLRHNRGGWYLRVIQPAIVKVGDEVRRIANPYSRWTIAQAMHIMTRGKGDVANSGELAALPPLSQRWKEQMGRRAPIRQ